MTLSVFQEQIENERDWREQEIRFLDNMQREIDNSGDREKLRRSILCLIYAHIEGFIQFSFSLYVDEINRKQLKCREVKPVIAAAVLHKEFIALQNSTKKNSIFSRSLPEDTHLHRLCRQSEFLEKISEISEKMVEIPEGYVNTESNVGKEVLEKLLYQVGLEYSDLKDVYAPLNKLLNVRNDIAHGKRKQGIDNKDYAEFLSCCRSIISAVSRRLTTAYGRNDYLAAS